MEHKNKRDVKFLIVINTKTLNTDKLLAQLTLKLQNLLPIQYIQLKTSEVMANGKKKHSLKSKASITVRARLRYGTDVGIIT